MSRKTIEVEKIRKMVNHRLANDVKDTPEVRAALSTLLEVVLMDTGNYHGFTHLRDHDVPKGAKPGCVQLGRDSNGAIQWEFPDDTRRAYF